MNSGLLQKNEETAFRLRGLYRSYGYQPYKMSKFEEYDLYVRNKSFLLSENILTFTDLDGKLMALKPDVTLSILKNGRGGPGLQKVYYSENVYRPSATAGGFREIPQTGLECIGSLDAAAEGEVLMLAAKSLAVISPEYLLDVSHQGFVAGLLEGLDLPDETRRRALAAMGAKNTPALERLAAEGQLPEKAAQTLSRLALLYDRPAPALAALQTGGWRQVVLQPLLLTAGTHARREISGPGPDSWAGQLRAAGLSVICKNRGLARDAGVRDIYLRRLQLLCRRPSANGGEL